MTFCCNITRNQEFASVICWLSSKVFLPSLWSQATTGARVEEFILFPECVNESDWQNANVRPTGGICEALKKRNLHPVKVSRVTSPLFSALELLIINETKRNKTPADVRGYGNTPLRGWMLNSLSYLRAGSILSASPRSCVYLISLSVVTKLSADRQSVRWCWDWQPSAATANFEDDRRPAAAAADRIEASVNC